MKTLANVTRYRCEFCKKEYQVGAACKVHEIRCVNNPDNKIACIGCDFIQTVEKGVGYENDYGYTEMKSSNGFFCKKKGIGMYPPKAVHKDLIRRFPETFKGEERMPTECNLYEFNPGF